MASSKSETAADISASGLAESVAQAMLRAVSSREEFRKFADSSDATIAIRPWIVYGGWIVLTRGNTRFIQQLGHEVGNG